MTWAVMILPGLDWSVICDVCIAVTGHGNAEPGKFACGDR
jgi:hypothetical protein